MPNPKAFISYSWDTPSHRAWVRQLAVRLQENGIIVLLDEWDIHPGADVTNYMETSVRESAFVLLVCTPAFAQRANGSKGGVGYEKAIVTGEIFSGSALPGKYVPVLRSGGPTESLPSYLKSRIFVDFRKDADFDGSFEILLRHLLDIPRYVRPPLGPEPRLSTLENTGPCSTSFVICSRCGRRPGVRDLCVGEHYEHDFRRFAGEPETVFCHRCGVGVGEKSFCVGTFYEHMFKQFEVPKEDIYCSRCGRHPGSRGLCTGKFYEHDFQIV
jgi:TIR domain-containing protein